MAQITHTEKQNQTQKVSTKSKPMNNCIRHSGIKKERIHVVLDSSHKVDMNYLEHENLNDLIEGSPF